MRIHETPLAGLLVLEPRVFQDGRGFFMETWRDSWLELMGITRPFIQDNHARSETRGVVRGLHFQNPPHAQAKLVWVTVGEVFDVAVDLRVGSPTYGQWHGVRLSAQNHLRFFVPEGFAHGYMTLTPVVEFQYKVNNYYAPGHEGGVIYNDATLSIDWPGDIEPVLSEKDTTLNDFAAFHSPFVLEK